VNENFNNFENLIIFMGKSGKQKLEETLRNWELDYETRKSITNEDSFLINIKNIKKKN
jgi:16S rRNA (guanine527-N7)-methyltransferase